MTGLVHDISPGVHDDRGRPWNDRQESSNIRLILKARGDNTPVTSPAVPPGVGHPTFPSNSNAYSYRRSRPQTSHQKAVDISRKTRVEHILHKQLIGVHEDIRRRKSKRGPPFGYTAMKRIYDLPDDYDSEDDRLGGPGGLVPNIGEDEDYGEGAMGHKKALDRAVRKLARGSKGALFNGLRIRPGKRKRKHEGNGGDDVPGEDEASKTGQRVDDNRQHVRSMQIVRARLGDRRQQGTGLKQEESLDDLDLDLLGENRDNDNEEGDIEEESVLDETEGEGDGMSE